MLLTFMKMIMLLLLLLIQKTSFKFGPNWVSIRLNVTVLVVIVVFMDVIDPRNLPLKFGQNRVINSSAPV